MDMVNKVNVTRWFNDIQTLASWNRYAMGTQIQTATSWLVQQFSAIPGLSVTTQSFPFRVSYTGVNVVATLTGKSRKSEYYIVGGHYDSTSQSPKTTAPGAEDNASGAAGVLEMARVFAQYPPEVSVQFICYSAEEQGLFGSQYNADLWVANAKSLKVVQVMDMIGYRAPTSKVEEVLIETLPAFEPLLSYYQQAASTYTLHNLKAVFSLQPFGSDHVPYLDRGMTALLSIDNDWDKYPDYHKTTDVPANINKNIGEDILRMNIAALQLIINAAAANLDTVTI